MVLELNPQKLLKDLYDARDVIDQRIREVTKVLQKPLPVDGSVVDGRPAGRSNAYKVLDGIQLLTNNGKHPILVTELARELFKRGLVKGDDEKQALSNTLRSVSMGKKSVKLDGDWVHYIPNKRKSRVGKNYFD